MMNDIPLAGGPGFSLPPYHLLTSRRRIPPFDLAQPYDYLVASDCILMRVPYLGTLMDLPVIPCDIRGLAPWASWCEGAADARETGREEMEVVQPFAPLYHIVRPGEPPPPLDTGRLYEYLVARSGVFLRAERYGFEVLMPVSPPCRLSGLADLQPYLRLSYPRVGPELVTLMLERARAQTTDGVRYDERLFYLLLREGVWEVLEPEQEQQAGLVKPKDERLPAKLGVFAEAHSHHTMSAFFSPKDDADEKWSGFYAVLGRITSEPEIRLRVVVDSYRWPCPADLLFDLPAGVRDALWHEPHAAAARSNERW